MSRFASRLGIVANPVLLTALVGGLVCCAPATAPPPAGSAPETAPEVSRKLAQFVYIEEGTDLILTVGTRVAGLRGDEPFFPLEVSVTNKARRTTWKIDRESFVLIDEDGQRYEMPSYRELRETYDKRTEDTRFFDARAFTAGKHEGYRWVESNFFPDPLVGVSRSADTIPGTAGVAPRSTSLVPLDTVELPYRSFLEDVLYFPTPDGALVGRRYSLEFRADGLQEPARIAFRIPEIVKRR